jgi:hypothetical protein
MKEENKTISWRAAEYEHVKKGAFWYLLIIGTAVLILGAAFWQKNFFFAIFILIAVIVLVVFGRAKPLMHDFRITEEGVGIGVKTFYNYDHLEGFAVSSRPGRLDAIIIKKKSTFNPILKIPIDSKLAVGARDLLLRKLPELEYEESIIDIFSDWLGF